MHIDFSTSEAVQSKSMKPWQGVLLGLIFVVIGIALLLFAVLNIKTYNEKSKTFVETTSKVVDYNYNDDGLQAIIVEYVVDGQTYQKASNSYSNMPKSIGTEVSIKYNPNHPKDAIWSSDSTNTILPIVGVLFTLVGIMVIITCIKNGKKQTSLEEQFVEQSNGLYSNIEIQPQMNSVNQQVSKPINNMNQSQLGNMNQQVPTVDIHNSNQQNNNINTNI